MLKYDVKQKVSKLMNQQFHNNFNLSVTIVFALDFVAHLLELCVFLLYTIYFLQ